MSFAPRRVMLSLVAAPIETTVSVASDLAIAAPGRARHHTGDVVGPQMTAHAEVRPALEPAHRGGGYMCRSRACLTLDV